MTLDPERRLEEFDNIFHFEQEIGTLHRAQRRLSRTVFVAVSIIILMIGTLLIWTQQLISHESKRNDTIAQIAVESKKNQDFDTQVLKVIRDATTPGGKLYTANREASLQNLLFLVNQIRQAAGLHPITRDQLLTEEGRTSP